MIDVVLGLDVSSSKVGLAIIDLNQNLLEYKLIKFDSKKPLEDRCRLLEHVVASYDASQYINPKDKCSSSPRGISP